MKNIVYIKDVQSGGSVLMLKLSAENYKDKVVVFVADTSDAQVNQVVDRAEHDFGIPRDKIYKKKDEVKNIGIIDNGLIVTNKTRSSIAATWEALPKDPDKVILIWDEADYDAPGHERDKNSDVAKHALLSKLSKHSSEIHYMTATVAGLAVSDLVFDEVIHLDTGENYLGYSDCTKVCLGDEDVTAMLQTGELSPTLKGRLLQLSEEGCIIRTCRKISDQNLVKEGIKKVFPEVEVTTFNGETKHLDPKTLGGIVISHQMAARGVSFPNIKHAIVDFNESTPQPVIVQSLRNLGYNKKLKENFILGNRKSLELVDNAFRVEKTYKKILTEYPDNPEKRKERIREHDLGYMDINILPLSKSNGFKHKKVKKEFKVLTTLPYTEGMKNELIAQGALLLDIVPTSEEVAKKREYNFVKWGGKERTIEERLKHFINNPPFAPVWLERWKNGKEEQYVSPKTTVKRLAPLDEISNATSTWGYNFNEEGAPVELVLYKKLEETERTHNFTDL